MLNKQRKSASVQEVSKIREIRHRKLEQVEETIYTAAQKYRAKNIWKRISPREDRKPKSSIWIRMTGQGRYSEMLPEQWKSHSANSPSLQNPNKNEHIKKFTSSYFTPNKTQF